MSLYLSDVDNLRILNLFEENCTRFWKALRTEIHFSTEKTQVVTGLSHPMFNGVLRTFMPLKIAALRVEETVNFFRRRNLPFHWIVGDRTRPSHLSSILVSKGLVLAEEASGIVCNLSDIAKTQVLSPDIRVVPVTGKALLKDWGPIFSDVFNMDSKNSNDFSALLAGNDSNNLNSFILYYNGTPAGTATLFINGGVAGIYHLGVKECFHTEDLKTAFVTYLLDYAKRVKCTHAALYASKNTLDTFVKLSFTKMCDTEIYILK